MDRPRFRAQFLHPRFWALWLGLGFAEYVLRFGAPSGITDRYVRHAVEQSPELDGYEGWVKAEARRGDASDIGNAARAFSGVCK